MLHQFAANTADEIWRQAAQTLLHGDDVIRQQSRLGATRELLHCAFVLRDPRQHWIVSRKPAMNPAFAIAEVIWILLGRDDARFVNFWNPGLPKFVGHGQRYYGAYGARLRSGLGFDQIERVYHALSANPNSRQAVLQIWDGRRDFPRAGGQPQDPDIPCNIVGMPRLQGDRLEWLQVMRSNDLFLGSPHNIVQFTVLQEVLAGWLGVRPGQYVQTINSLHFYEADTERIHVAAEEQPRTNPDRLDLPKADFDRVLQILEARMERLTDPVLSETAFIELINADDLPHGWRNMYLVAAADAARRRRWHEGQSRALAACDNPVLHAVWTGWATRQRERA